MQFHGRSLIGALWIVCVPGPISVNSGKGITMGWVWVICPLFVGEKPGQGNAPPKSRRLDRPKTKQTKNKLDVFYSHTISVTSYLPHDFSSSCFFLLEEKSSQMAITILCLPLLKPEGAPICLQNKVKSH